MNDNEFRAALGRLSVVASLDTDPDVEAAWAAEVERRHEEIESGVVTTLSGPEMLAQLKAEFV